MNTPLKLPSVTPFSLKDAPSLIERIFPVQKMSAEAQKERLGAQSQTLTPLGSYWKGRKPLILVRACVLAALLPSTGDDEADLAALELLIGLSDQQIEARMRDSLSADAVAPWIAPSLYPILIEDREEAGKTVRYFKNDLSKEERKSLIARAIARMPYSLRIESLFRPEEVGESELIDIYLDKVNAQFGISATSLPELVQQLGLMRFGRTPRIADTFSGGGSIPFEAARIGCDVYASDLNPIACMLTWGALNVIGADSQSRASFAEAQDNLMRLVDAELASLGVEHDEAGNRAKAYLYCLEVVCPQTGWKVPLSPTWVISKVRKIVGKLVPNNQEKRFDIEIITGASDADMRVAETGTLRGGDISYEIDGEAFRVSFKAIRGDFRTQSGQTGNALRPWEKTDIVSRNDDILVERLYAIQWISKATLNSGRQDTFFLAPTQEDIERELFVKEYVCANLVEWQNLGHLPDLMIEAGDETARLIRERGWTYWHHLFSPRDLLIFGLMRKLSLNLPHEEINAIFLARSLDWNSRLCRWRGSVGKEANANVFSNQALNTISNTVSRSFWTFDGLKIDNSKDRKVRGNFILASKSALSTFEHNDLFITDPPYADAVNYHEITEFFIAWLRKNPSENFKNWTWDSRRPLAIKGDGEEFRNNMVAAYRAMADHMPDNGLQIVMFTHQDAGVWADMAQIFWGAGLRVMAAWYIATETTSELKKGGYVQGTVILVLRKRLEAERGYKDEIVQEVKAEVAKQIDTMVGLNQTLRGHGRIENLFEDADLQMAGYAAALRVLTRYALIDGVDMTKEALRPRKKGERGVVGEIIEFAVQVANEHLVPEGLEPKLWDKLNGSERFFMRMLDVETSGAKKLDNYQNFAKAFRVGKDWQQDLMGSLKPNEARLKTATEFKKSNFDGDFGGSRTRAVLYALHEIDTEIDGDLVLSHLRELVPGYLAEREELMAIASYIAQKRVSVVETEARAARILVGLMRNERLG